MAAAATATGDEAGPDAGAAEADDTASLLAELEAEQGGAAAKPAKPGKGKPAAGDPDDEDAELEAAEEDADEIDDDLDDADEELDEEADDEDELADKARAEPELA